CARDAFGSGCDFW
nr:immunoglobulin heavy chain junction region [Macaca mulatta]MOX60067.1 immunoglobulin heavy chain junction region [Macaca mulatta]MOX60959.1 immunoglobulin heavy chain junction region [Macaca mulatta]MOX61400.1 immunoglobulin heavy chain junction region [Macaca mulatta]MOX63298.1 immunoglobulin heavy chain junction region [Macaca mulatta]